MNRVFLVCCLVLLLSACQIGQPTDTLTLSTPTVAATTSQVKTDTPISTQTETQLPTDTPTPTEPTPTAVPTKGKTIVVTSTADSGPGTLRQVLLDAGSGDTITFDPSIFPPQSPSRIILANCLPEVIQDHLTIDARDAGVILDGSHIEAEWCSGIRIISTSWNTIQGLRFEGFSPGAGVEVAGGAQHNLVKENIVGFSDVGFVLGGKETSFNNITENFIGVDIDGKSLERTSVGIWIEDGASHNTISANNIAYNSDGIMIVDSKSVGNTITQNSIYENQFGGIGGIGSSSVQLPTIIDFDLEKGTIAGFTCPNCLIELFSDEGNQGRIFEGQIAADSKGNFSLNRDAPFTGPHLTATATDDEGNTSSFSAPTWGSNSSIVLQERNTLPKTLLQPKTSSELEENHIGGDIGNWQWQRDQDNTELYEDMLLEITNAGLNWVRTNFWSPNPLNWQEVLRAPGVFEIPRDVDQFITELSRNGINIVLTLSAGAGLDGPEHGWRGGSGWGVLGYREPDWWFNIQENRDNFIAYARFMVQHFKGRVRYYELWNEPSAGEYPADGRGGVAVNDYVTLIKQVVPVIRQIDTDAKIVVGAMGPFQERERQWLRTVFDFGAAPFVDAVSWHAFSGDSPLTASGEYPRHEEPYYWRDYPVIVQDIKDYIAAQGFSGEFMVEETGWRTLNDYTDETPLYTDIEAAKYTARANIIHLGLDFAMVSNQFLMPDVIKRLPRYYVIRNLSTIMAGAELKSLPIEIQSEATNLVSYTFSLPNGDHLIALWTDGVAVNDDPGVPATLTIPNFSAEKVTGIDVLHGFEQELITSTENGNLVIRDLLVKDYPLILRLSE